MALNFQFILFWLAVLAVGIVLAYFLLSAISGSQAARKNLVYSTPWIVLGGLAVALIPLLGTYGLIVLLGVYLLAVAIWLMSWPARRKNAGEVKLSIAKTGQDKAFIWMALLTAGCAIALTLFLLDRLTGPITTPAGTASGIVQILFLWTIPLFFLLLSRSPLEIRENGIAYLFAWQPWERIVAFGWDDDKPNTLLFKLVPRSPVSRRYMAMTIPSDRVETVDRLLERYLIEDENLDDEIDGEHNREINNEEPNRGDRNQYS